MTEEELQYDPMPKEDPPEQTNEHRRALCQKRKEKREMTNIIIENMTFQFTL